MSLKGATAKSRLNGRQVIRCTGLIVALLCTRLGLGVYEFADESIDRYSTVLWTALIVLLPIIIAIGPECRAKKLSLWLLTPLAILFAMAGCGVLARLDQEHPDGLDKTALVGDVRINLISYYDVRYDQISKICKKLEVERPVFGGLLKQKNCLLTLCPAATTDFVLIDHGKKILLTTAALAGRKAIARTYDTDWNSKRNRYDDIGLTAEEIKGYER